MLNCSLSWCLEFKILPPRTSCWTSAPRLTFMAGAPPGDAFEKHRLHIMLVDSPRWVRFLKLTDWLRTRGQTSFSKPRRFPAHASCWLVKENFRSSRQAPSTSLGHVQSSRTVKLLVAWEGTTLWSSPRGVTSQLQSILFLQKGAPQEMICRVKSKRRTQWGVWWSHFEIENQLDLAQKIVQHGEVGQSTCAGNNAGKLYWPPDMVSVLEFQSIVTTFPVCQWISIGKWCPNNQLYLPHVAAYLLFVVVSYMVVSFLLAGAVVFTHLII